MSYITPSLRLGPGPGALQADSVDEAVKIIRRGGVAAVANAIVARDVLVDLGMADDDAATRIITSLAPSPVDVKPFETTRHKTAFELLLETKARDADGDGFINDGTPQQRPAPPPRRKPRRAKVRRQVQGVEREIEVAYLTEPDERWSPTPPDDVVSIAEILSDFKPEDHGETWEQVRTRIETDKPGYLAKLTQSIRDNWIQTPIELDLETETVQRGHHRLIAAQDAGLTEVPVAFGRQEEAWEWDPATGEHTPYEYAPDDFADEEYDTGEEADQGPRWEDRRYYDSSKTGFDKLARDIKNLPGWTLSKTGPHQKAWPPDSGPITLPNTPGDVRSMRNSLALLRRHGFPY